MNKVTLRNILLLVVKRRQCLACIMRKFWRTDQNPREGEILVPSPFAIYIINLVFMLSLGWGGHFDSFSREKSLCQFELHFGRYLIYVTNLGLLLHACVWFVWLHSVQCIRLYYTADCSWACHSLTTPSSLSTTRSSSIHFCYIITIDTIIKPKLKWVPHINVGTRHEIAL